MVAAKKTVLITGCSSGIGHSLALEYNKKGFRVFATARQAASISDLTPHGIETLSLEVHKPESVASAKAEIIRLTGGKLDILVNNAGRNYTVLATDVDFDEVQMTFEVNVFAVMRMCQAFAPLLIEAKGTIVQIGSLAGLMPYVMGSVYNATKAALHQYSDTLRVELAPFDVKVVNVITGGVQSSIARTKRALPSDSIYLPIEKEYNERLTHSQANGVPSEEYARVVVSKTIESYPPRRFWAGGKIWQAWLGLQLPRWAFYVQALETGAMEKVTGEIVRSKYSKFISRGHISRLVMVL